MFGLVVVHRTGSQAGPPFPPLRSEDVETSAPAPPELILPCCHFMGRCSSPSVCCHRICLLLCSACVLYPLGGAQEHLRLKMAYLVVTALSCLRAAYGPPAGSYWTEREVHFSGDTSHGLGPVRSDQGNEDMLHIHRTTLTIILLSPLRICARSFSSLQTCLDHHG